MRVTRQNPAPNLEQLEPRLFLSADPALTALFGAAQEISIAPANSVTLDGTIASDDDIQTYRCAAPATGKLLIDMSAENGGLDSLLQVYNDRGRRVKLNDNASRDTLDSSVSLRVRPGQTYYVLAAANGDTTGEYQLTLASDPNDDLGNTMLAAREMRVARGRARQRAILNYQGDADVLKIVTDRTGPMEIDLTGVGRYNDLAGELVIFDASGNQVGRDLGSAGQHAHVSMDVGLGEEYYVMLTGSYSGELSRANVTVSLPTDDIGDTFPTATDLTLKRGKGSVRGSTDYTGDVDIVRVVASSTAPMSVTVTPLRKSTFQGTVTVYDAEGTVVASQSSASGTVSFQADTLAGQTYYIAVAGTYEASAQHYLLTVLCPQDDISGDFDGALFISLSNAQGSSSGEIDFLQDTDMFKVVSSITGSMTVDVAASGRKNDLNATLTVYDSTHQQIAYDDDGGLGLNASATFDVVDGETYYLLAGSYVDTTEGTYNITVNIVDDVIPDPTPEPDPEPDPEPQPTPDDDAPLPGAEIVAELLDLNGSQRLRIAGTDGADVITLSQSLNTVTVTTAAGSQTFTGNIVDIVIYGFDGDDTIRLTSTVSVSGLIYAGAGNDDVFESGTGSVTIYAEAGDDLVVSVGGGSDTIYGGVGFDTFWGDSTDHFGDVSSAETSAKSVHSITTFYQPFDATAGSSQYISLEIAGQDLADPVITSAATDWANFADVPLFVDGPQYDDIAQGQVGDCYYLACLSSLADSDPMVIEQMITPLGDGTFAVRFHRAGEEVYLRLDGDLPVNSYGSLVYAKAGPDGELWVPMLEKAYAFFRYEQDSYASISGGWMSVTFRDITGGYTNTTYTDGSINSLYNHISNMLSQDYSVTLGSYYSAASPVVGSHAYTVRSVETVAGQQYVTVYNPWGWDGRTWDNNSYDGMLTLSMEQIQNNFSAVVTSLV